MLILDRSMAKLHIANDMVKHDAIHDQREKKVYSFISCEKCNICLFFLSNQTKYCSQQRKKMFGCVRLNIYFDKGF